MTKAVKPIDELTRVAHGLILEKTANKLFFTDAEYQQHRGKIDLINSLKSEILNKIEAK